MVFEKVKRMLAEQLFVEEGKITAESDLVSDLNADSLDLVQLLILMEKEFGVKFSDEEIKAVKTVGDVVKFIENYAK